MRQILTFKDILEKKEATEKWLLYIGLNMSGVDDLTIKGGEDPADLHVTLLYGYYTPIGTRKAAELSVQRAIESIEDFIPEQIEFDATGRFEASESSDGLDVIYARVKAGQLEKAHEAIIQALAKEGIKVEQTFPEYHPHMTLAYIDPEEDFPLEPIKATGTIKDITIGAGPDEEPVTKTEEPQTFHIEKTDNDKRLVFGWANIAFTADGEQIEDLQHDIIDTEDLEEAVYKYVLEFRDAGEEHIPSMRKKATLVESVMFTKEKMKAMGIPEGIVPEGWWIGFYVKDDDAWERIKNGTYQMFSIEGTAIREKVEDDIEKADRVNGCGVLVVKDGKILTGTRIGGKHANQICGPGGHIEAGETHEEAAIRETREEFGIECKELVPLGILDNGRSYGKSAVFLCTEYDGEPHTDEEEMTDVKWRTPSELEEERLFYPFELSLDLLADRIEKANPYHDERGRFTTASGGGGASQMLSIEVLGYREINSSEASEMAEEMHSDMTDADKMFLSSDATGYFQSVNSFMVNYKLNMDEPLDAKEQKLVDTMDRNMKPITRDVQVTRMVDEDFLAEITGGLSRKQFTEENLQFLKGAKVTNKGYMSTSYDIEKNAFDQRNVRLVLNVPKGSKAMMSPTGKEAEIVLARNTSYKITSLTSRESTRWVSQRYDVVIHAEVIGTMEKSFSETFLDVIQKFNPFHDAKGRFASSNGFATYSANPKTKAGAMAISRSAQAGHGTTFNSHKESQGENINQNYAWLNGGPGAKQLGAQGQLASQQPKTPPKPQKNYDRLGFADSDDADYHQLYAGRQYYQQQQLSPAAKNACNKYLDPNTEAGSLYNFSQNMNQAVVTGTINKASNRKYKAVYDELMNNMHNLGHNVELTRYDHGGFLDDQLAQVGITSRRGMSVAQMRQALVGHSYGDNRILSTSYNNFQKASNHSTFSTREVKIVYKAKASTQVLMPGDGPGGKFGEMLLAPTGTGGGNKYTIVDVNLTGARARPKGGSQYNLSLNQIEVVVEVG